MNAFLRETLWPFRRRLSTNLAIRLSMTTWNTAGKAPPDLKNLFSNSADIYAIGFQEMGSQDWVAALDNAMADEDVVRIKTRKLQGMMTVVYIQRHILHHVTHVESEITKTGLGGMWGNKGGVSIRFDVYGINVIVVNCHLAAHMENVKDRIQDVTDILEDQKFRDEGVSNILDHDYVFWMGDMNFRIDNISFETALSHIERNKVAPLLKEDQLKAVMGEGLIFPGFKEAKIRFPPSYKFDVGTDTYDTSPKKRVPAYCDRIVYFYHDISYGKRDHLSVKSNDYKSHPSFKTSDHKPVSCTLDFLGRSRPPLNPVTFQVGKYVTRSRLSVPYVSNRMDLTSSDWIGIYRAKFIDLLGGYITYQWVSVAANSPFNGSVEFAESYLSSLPKGTPLVLCYISKKNSISGMSSVFKLKD